MRKIYLLLPFLLSFALLTCEKEPDPPLPEPPPTLDQRFVGGRWYFPAKYDNSVTLSPKTSDGYYKFTEDGKLEYSSETTYNKIVGNTLSGKSVYSSNGIIYWKDTNQKAIQFSFHSTFPYKSGSIIYPAIGVEYLVLDKLASKGDLITYSLFDTSGNLSDTPTQAARFLVRFKDDGTPYRNYNE